jgi:hypothetical protein
MPLGLGNDHANAISWELDLPSRKLNGFDVNHSHS